jgi:glucose-6-phosphate dehydrogenase assembly protein OpcA
MSEDVWSAENTSPDEIDSALRELVRTRHATDRALAPARVLNLVVVVDREWKGEISNRLDRVGRYHASRTVLCAVEEGRETLDATAVVGYEERVGTVGVLRERVEIDLGPRHLASLATIVDPVLVDDLQTMLWCPHGHHEAVGALLGMVDVMLLDSDEGSDSAPEALARAAELLASAYVVDLAWLRTTPWRERLAASFDPLPRRRALGRLNGLSVRHRPSSPSSAVLLAGWLASRLRWEPEALRSMNGAGLRGSARGAGQEVEITLEPFDQEAPGLAGVTVSCTNGFSLSLDRALGGLRARERTAKGGERQWQVLGASRGEGGILGEGVRQALLRDPTYGPALAAARTFCVS